MVKMLFLILMGNRMAVPHCLVATGTNEIVINGPKKKSLHILQTRRTCGVTGVRMGRAGLGKP